LKCSPFPFQFDGRGKIVTHAYSGDTGTAGLGFGALRKELRFKSHFECPRHWVDSCHIQNYLSTLFFFPKHNTVN